MARTRSRQPKRLTARQQRDLGTLRAQVRRIEHTKGLTDTVWHERLARLEALAASLDDDQSEDTEVGDNESSSVLSVLDGQ